MRLILKLMNFKRTKESGVLILYLIAMAKHLRKATTGRKMKEERKEEREEGREEVRKREKEGREGRVYGDSQFEGM